MILGQTSGHDFVEQELLVLGMHGHHKHKERQSARRRVVGLNELARHVICGLVLLNIRLIITLCITYRNHHSFRIVQHVSV